MKARAKCYPALAFINPSVLYLTLEKDIPRALNLKDIVSNGNRATFDHFRKGRAFYTVLVDHESLVKAPRYMFPVPVDDLNGATIHAEEKAITLMRYIRKALDEETFIKA